MIKLHMNLLDEEKNKLKDCLNTANNFIILTTGRAGTDFLQSCYDNHPEVASTSEKTIYLASFIEKNKSLLPESSDLFAALAIKELFFSFAPFLNKIEDWRITKRDNYRKANVRKFLDCLSYLLGLEDNLCNSLSITRAIILSFTFSIGKDISNIKSILIHLHHINRLSDYSENLDSDDLIIVCSRNPYDLLASGVFHWRKYWIKSQIYDYSACLGHYRYVFKRTVNDYLDVKANIGLSNSAICISILEKLSNINYLNAINKYLSIDIFDEFPRSSVLGINRRGDLLSSDSKRDPKGSYDESLVKRGSPFKRLGFVDSILLTLICKERIDFYGFNIEIKLLKRILRFNIFARIILFIILIPIPSRIEILYYRDILNQYINIITSRKISKSQKFKQIIYLTFYISLYPFEYLYSRIFRIKTFIQNIQLPKFLSEIEISP